MRLAALLLPLIAPMLMGAQTADASLLAAMRDQARPVLLFAGPSDPRVAQQYAALVEHSAELRDRQMRIVLVTQSRTTGDAYTPVGTVAATEPEAESLRKQFHVERNTFTLVLLGKDGGEKYRSTRLVPFETLRRLVDSMPMRQQEMRSR